MLGIYKSVIYGFNRLISAATFVSDSSEGDISRITSEPHVILIVSKDDITDSEEFLGAIVIYPYTTYYKNMTEMHHLKLFKHVK